MDLALQAWGGSFYCAAGVLYVNERQYGLPDGYKSKTVAGDPAAPFFVFRDLRIFSCSKI